MLKLSPESCTEPLHDPPELVVAVRLWTAFEKVIVKLSVRGTLLVFPLVVVTVLTAVLIWSDAMTTIWAFALAAGIGVTMAVGMPSVTEPGGARCGVREQYEY